MGAKTGWVRRMWSSGAAPWSAPNPHPNPSINRFLGILKSFLNGCDLAIPVFVYFFLRELLLHRNPNPRSKEKGH